MVRGKRLSLLQEKEIEAPDEALQGVSSSFLLRREEGVDVNRGWIVLIWGLCGAGGLNSLSSWLNHLLVGWRAS